MELHRHQGFTTHITALTKCQQTKFALQEPWLLLLAVSADSGLLSYLAAGQ